MSTVTAVIQNNILNQLDASRKIFDIIQKLATATEEDTLEARKALIEAVMRELLELGDKLANDANAAGLSLAKLVARNTH